MTEEEESYYGVPPGTSPAASSGDGASTGLFNLLGNLGTAYFGAQGAQAAAQNNQTTGINSAGRVVNTATPTSGAAPAQIIPGLENRTLFLGVGAVVGLVVLLAVLRKN